MIAKPIITKWREIADWPLDDQVEQDLVISRALVEIFNNEFLKTRIAFRGGTALHKLVFPHGLRYSEDIDLNRLEKGPSKPIIDNVRKALVVMLGEPKKVKRTANSVKIIYDYQSVSGETSRLKIEINTRETLPQEKLNAVPFKVESEYFSGETVVMSFDKEEMIGTKIRALYQRRKGRDLFDLYELSKLDLNWDKIVDSFKKLDIGVSQKEYAKNLEEKMQDQGFLEDLGPLLPADIEYDVELAYQWFEAEVLSKI
ncbi:nucleotidyl transferase AbiEii/AbiGii toxin family protein [Halobacteriovorax sp. HLS]|uniref:nucleotidyl transferase AbiEii/AbiGii toxin family protein n=1 Tax=Halobacteriovorax sp. HLS TaxID=2234000 RepID=UPI000FD8C72D|nr:nucleotidyl transferase AbiEii/AbiGii toxin family protein [Halobacteriovorax sp. HLS]